MSMRICVRFSWSLGGNEWRWCKFLFAWEKQLWDERWTIVANFALQVDTSYSRSGYLILIRVIHLVVFIFF
jgi:hypothetical protein